jgi:predicted alpha/beta superfamily hydrolase
MSKPKTARARISMTCGVTLPGSSRFDLTSRISRRTYRIFVARPLAPPPKAGYPVVTVTDGGLTFPITAGQNLSFGFDGGKAALVVGVAYATDDPAAPMRLRTRDLTPETPLGRIHRLPGQPAPRLKDYGGAERFYRFLVEELRPAIAAAFPTDLSDQTLYGHSLGGLFALGVMFNHPGAFRTYAASSPSIWWNRRALLKGEGAFASRVKAGEIAPRVLVTIGACEQTPTDPPAGMTAAQMRKLSQRARMVDNARELGARLALLKGADGYVARFVEFADEDHMSVIPASLSRTLTFALRS